MKIKTIKVSAKGQIAIPLEMRKSAGLRKGDELVVIQKGNKFLLEKAADFTDEMKDEFKDLIKFSEKSLKKLWNNKDDEIWSTYMVTHG